MNKMLKIGLISLVAFGFSTPSALASKHQMDVNGDGNITAEEHAAASAERFKKMDLNGDGVATKDERKEAKKKAKEMKEAKKKAKDEMKDAGKAKRDEEKAKRKGKEDDNK